MSWLPAKMKKTRSPWWNLAEIRTRKTYNGKNLVSTLAASFLIGFSSFLQVTSTTIKAWMSSNLGRIPPLTSELVALEHLKKCHMILLAI